MTDSIKGGSCEQQRIRERGIIIMKRNRGRTRKKKREKKRKEKTGN